MQTQLVRLKPHDPRRGYVMRRYTYRGIKFHVERGWYRVTKDVADYLKDIRQVAGQEHSPPAFDICSDQEAMAIDAKEKKGAASKAAATDSIKVSPARELAGTVTTGDLPEDEKGKKGRGK